MDKGHQCERSKLFFCHSFCIIREDKISILQIVFMHVQLYVHAYAYVLYMYVHTYLISGTCDGYFNLMVW